MPLRCLPCKYAGALTSFLGGKNVAEATLKKGINRSISLLRSVVIAPIRKNKGCLSAALNSIYKSLNAYTSIVTGFSK